MRQNRTLQLIASAEQWPAPFIGDNQFFNLSRIRDKSASAIIGDTLFPIILKLCHAVG